MPFRIRTAVITADQTSRHTCNQPISRRDPHLVKRPAENQPSLPHALAHLTPAHQVHLGADVFALTGAVLDHNRIALSDSALATELDATVSTLIDDGAELSEPTRTRPPAGFQPAEPAARFAVRDVFHVVQRFPHPEAIGTAQFVTWCADHLAPFQPLHQWLTRHASR